MCISTDFKSLERAFLALPNEGVLPKETPLISVLKNLLKQDACITLIGHVIGTNFEESLSTLQYVERCKAEVVGGERGANMETANVGGMDQLLRNLNQIKEEYKREIEQTERKNDAQLERIKSILGLNIDIKTILHPGLSQKDKLTLENHKDAGQRAKNFMDRNKDAEERLIKTKAAIERVKNKIDDKSFYFNKLLGKLNEELSKLTTESTKLKTQYNQLPTEMATHIEEERKTKIEEKQQEMEQKLDLLFSAQVKIDHCNEQMSEATRTYENAKKEYENSYKNQARLHRKQQDDGLINLSKQYQHFLSIRKEELSKFMQEAEQYCKKKKTYKKLLKQEIIKLKESVQKQAGIISRAESGAYTDGIKSINIAKFEKPSFMASSTHYKMMAAEISKKSQTFIKRPETAQSMIQGLYKTVVHPSNKKTQFRTIRLQFKS